jgi:hypothetical protein
MNDPTRQALFLAALLGAVLSAGPTNAQTYTLRTSVAAGGGSDAAGGTYTLLGTVGQPAAGTGAGGPYDLGAGFWPQAAPLLGPAPLVLARHAPFGLALTVTPLDRSRADGPADRFRFQVTVTNASEREQHFQVWTAVTLPDGAPYPVLAPQDLTLPPGEAFGPVSLVQEVPPNAPAGTYAYTVYVGAFPDEIAAGDGFLFTRPGTPAPHTRSTEEVAGTTRRVAPGSREASTGAGEATAPTREAHSRSRANAASRDGGTSADRRSAVPPSQTVTPRFARGGRALAFPMEWPVFIAATGQLVVENGDLSEAARFTEAPALDAEAIAAEATAPDAEVETGTTALPVEVALAPPYPNPARLQATLRFALPESQRVRLAVYDALGREVALLVSGEIEAGRHGAVLDAARLPSGTYLVRLEAGSETRTQRVTVLR